MISALCNIYLNSEEKLAVFKQTFPLVFPVSDNWLICIRGNFRDEANNYIRIIASEKIENCIFFPDSNENYWAKKTIAMLKQARYPTIYIYIEDHLLINNIETFRKTVSDMKENQIDFFSYSFFDQSITRNSIEILQPSNTEYFRCFSVTKNNINFFQKYFSEAYLFSLPGVVSLRYLSALLQYEQMIQFQIPVLFQGFLSRFFGFRSPFNRFIYSKINKVSKFFNTRIVIYNKNSPFNTERSALEIEPQLLPIKIGLLNKELFGCIEDDNTMPGSSLIKRGLYPVTLKATSPSNLNQQSQIWHEFDLTSEKSLTFSFCLDKQRVKPIPLKNIVVSKGELTVSSPRECYTLKQDEQMWVHANIPHTISAKLDSKFKTLLIFN